MTTTFLDLPDELILRVAELLYSEDRCNLRLLTKRMEHLISPMLFETMYFPEPYLSPPEIYESISEYLSLGKDLVFSRCTKTMNFSLSGRYDVEENPPWLRLLNILVPTLTSLNSLKWSHWSSRYPISPLLSDAFNSFGSIPSLRELAIEVFVSKPFPRFTLKSFSNLISVSISWRNEGSINQNLVEDIADLLGRCPSLEHFKFKIPRPYNPSEVPMFAHIFARLPSNPCLPLKQLDLTGIHVSADDFRAHLCHLRSLKILRLKFNRRADSPEQNDQICRLLLDNSIYLVELAIDTTHTTGILEYLESYSGLEYLTFQSRHPGADTPEGVHRFFASVLPLHSGTLRELHLGWSVETLWTRYITSEDLAHIEKCQQLTELSCYITITVGSTGRTDRLLRAWLEAAMKLTRLQYFLFYPTCPLLPTGEYDRTIHPEHFIAEGIEEFATEHVVLFKALVFPPTL